MDKATLKEKLLREKQFVDKTIKMLEDVNGYSAILDKERVLELGEMAMSTWNKFIPELESGLSI
ncbi:MAG: hypothetical protein COT45_01750 [bacterium (Candidatus Stahlbacteria) CG08_land_8_20_14_0_20_40_26]|nr:MAG: hypothetical protein COX49_08280 [bacterium (Candidatus Stahlbacteria) CG23_combo_of_CG06-09_8_20_14_all_40_9]PIS25858.1 MAG: hypothetical protein COT45_01750 [bacterium (Candidatus Stahlbacteria) CG08_land_8_20_14_0_20_40_26]